MKENKQAVWSWAFYDWANSAYSTTVMAGFFPLFFKEYWADPNNPTHSTFYLGMANSIASLVVAALAPLLGSVADQGSAKKKFLILFAFLGVIMTGGLWMVAQGNWQMAVFFYVLATIGFASGNVFYDALLPGLASEERVDVVSSLGFGLGYLGGGLLFLVNVFMYLKPEIFGIPDGATAIKLSFLSVAVWWAVFTIPLILFVPEPKNYDTVDFKNAVRMGWIQLVQTFKEIRNMKVVGTFLLAYWFYIDGVDTIIRMAVDYGMSLNFPGESLIIALLIVQFVAFPAALIYGWLASKIGTKTAIMVGIIAYSFITLLGYFMTEAWHFYVLAILIGLFMGGIQALSRSLYTRIIPPAKSAEFFGFYNMLGKFAAIIGPALMGTIALATGSARLGILSILLLFILGAFFLNKVDIEEGKRLAAKGL
ncbi:MAG TPA: MFS transporter [Candidatus Marinimicrobia bacterium]|nr:MFS transporter [Candidatus Neomarinimicrobiota bacterium]HIN26405.1 MFS transporter [Candidatus Neomarinimicrobiota bacterium]